MNEEQGRKLEDHVFRLNQAQRGGWAERIAASILSDPQAHIDALVAAGVLCVEAGRAICSIDGKGGGRIYYPPESVPTITLNGPVTEERVQEIVAEAFRNHDEELARVIGTLG